MRRGLRASAFAGILLASLTALPGNVGAADQNYYWRWSDGSRLAARTFALADYGLASNLPDLIITADPPSPRRDVRLQFYADGEWTTESTARTDARGIARIALDPNCGEEGWCRRTFRYQLLIGGQNARLTITYAQD